MPFVMALDAWTLYDPYDGAYYLAPDCILIAQETGGRFQIQQSGGGGCNWTLASYYRRPLNTEVSEPYGEGVGGFDIILADVTRDSMYDPGGYRTMTAVGLEIIPFDGAEYRYGIYLDEIGGSPAVVTYRYVYPLPGVPTTWTGSPATIGAYSVWLRITREAGAPNSIAYRYSTDGGSSWTTLASETGGSADMLIENVALAAISRKSNNTASVSFVYSAASLSVETI